MNPLGPFIVSLALGVVVLVSLDPVTAGLATGAGLVAILAWRVPWSRVWMPLVALVASASLAGVTTALYGQASGNTVLTWGVIHITSGSLNLAATVSLRILGLGFPGIAVFARTTPSRLADALGQVWHLPARFVLGSLAAMRLTTTLRQDWSELAMARRARGMGDARRATGFIFALPALTMGLLIRALRRANILATAMESRGLGNDIPRTWAHESQWRARDWTVVTLGILMAAGIVVVSVILGSWRVVYG